MSSLFHSFWHHMWTHTQYTHMFVVYLTLKRFTMDGRSQINHTVVNAVVGCCYCYCFFLFCCWCVCVCVFHLSSELNQFQEKVVWQFLCFAYCLLPIDGLIHTVVFSVIIRFTLILSIYLPYTTLWMNNNLRSVEGYRTTLSLIIFSCLSTLSFIHKMVNFCVFFYLVNFSQNIFVFKPYHLLKMVAHRENSWQYVHTRIVRVGIVNWARTGYWLKLNEILKHKLNYHLKFHVV